MLKDVLLKDDSVVAAAAAGDDAGADEEEEDEDEGAGPTKNPSSFGWCTVIWTWPSGSENEALA